jgi:hypothetical protein
MIVQNASSLRTSEPRCGRGGREEGNGWSMCAPHRIRKHEESGEKLDPARNEPGKFLVKSNSSMV